MAEHEVVVDVRGPWSLAISRAFWEGFTPSALAEQAGEPALSTIFRVDADWRPAAATVVQEGAEARVRVVGDGDLDAAAAQVCRFLSGRGPPAGPARAAHRGDGRGAGQDIVSVTRLRPERAASAAACSCWRR
jgi:hypothetical protein